MIATILKLNNEYKQITARNSKSLQKKLAKNGIVISEIDMIFISMKSGYSNIESSKNWAKINIATK